MFGCIDKRRAADRKIFLDLDRHRRCLTAREIVAPDVSRLLEHDRVFADRRKLDVEISEVRELLGFLRRKVDNEQIHAVVAIGDEIDLVVRSPHRADVLRGIVRQIFGGAGFEIVNPNVVRHAAAIMFPGAELAEDAVVSHLGIIRRKRNETAARHRQLLGQFRVHPDGKQ